MRGIFLFVCWCAAVIGAAALRVESGKVMRVKDARLRVQGDTTTVIVGDGDSYALDEWQDSLADDS